MLSKVYNNPPHPKPILKASFPCWNREGTEVGRWSCFSSGSFPRFVEGSHGFPLLCMKTLIVTENTTHIHTTYIISRIGPRGQMLVELVVVCPADPFCGWECCRCDSCPWVSSLDTLTNSTIITIRDTKEEDDTIGCGWFRSRLAFFLLLARLETYISWFFFKCGLSYKLGVQVRRVCTLSNTREINRRKRRPTSDCSSSGTKCFSFLHVLWHMPFLFSMSLTATYLAFVFPSNLWYDEWII